MVFVVGGEVKLGKTRLGTPAPVRTGGQIDPLASTVGALGSQPVLPQPTLSPGLRIGHYELIRELGRGGMGVVFAARDTRLGRRVAIKFLLQASDEIAERFMVEARATAQCTHDHIVIIHEVGEHADMPYMVLEFLEGQSLRDKLGGVESGRRMPASRVVELALPIARALARAHEMGIVHRDLKPENVLVTSAGQVKVLDFGIAKALGPREARPMLASVRTVDLIDSKLTTHGALIGTVPYMSPEQFGQQVEIDHRTDLWALGILMFEMLAGHHPARELSADAIITHLVEDAPVVSIGSIVPETPPQLVRIIDSCLVRDREKRIASAADVVRRLEELVPGRRRREFAEGECPYPGLASFQEHDADRFFGRDREIARMVARVRELPLTAVVGPSGAGKSSFVRAGVVPALKASGERWEAITLRPGRQPIEALASVLERITRNSRVVEPDQHAKLVQRLRTEAGFLGAFLRRRAQESDHDIVLFVDQFEELYTLVPDEAERLAFTRALSGAADDVAAPIRVILSMRSDFLDRVAEDPLFVEEVSRGLIFLGETDHAGLRDAVIEPAELVGYRFESEAMVEDMLRDLAMTPNPLPLLQFAATKLWDVRDRHARMFTLAGYRACGGVTGALAVHADEIVSTMDASTRMLARRICRELVTPERTRAIAELVDLERLADDEADVRRVIDQLVAARLVIAQSRGDSEGATVELVHESLIEQWPTLRRWLDEDQDDAAFAAQLASAAKQWEARQRAPGLLWRGEAMEEARRWAAERHRQLPARDRAFLDAVLALGRRSKRAKRVALVAAFVVLGGVAAAMSVAYVRVSEAKHEARIEAKRATEALEKERVATAARSEAEQRRLIAIAALLNEEQLREAAEAGLFTAQQLTAIAEERRLIAERKRAKAEAGRTAAERERDAAEAALRQAEAERAAAQQTVQLTREELVDKNKKLEDALAAARRESTRAESLRAEAERTKTQLQQSLAVEKARVQKLEDEKRKISTKLK